MLRQRNSFLWAAPLAVVIAFGSSTDAAAQGWSPENRARAERATNRLVSLAALTQRSHQTSLSELHNAAAERRALLAALMPSDPASFLRLALPDGMRRSLPRDVQQHVEEQIQLEGDLEVISEDYDRDARVRHFLWVAGKRLGLYLANPSSALRSGDRVRVRGVQLGDNVAADGSLEGGAIQQVTSALPYAFGEQKALWILVNFEDNAVEPYTVSAAHDLLFNTVSNFYRENSQNQTWLSGDVVGWFTIPVSSTTCDVAAILSNARTAAERAGVDLSQYQRFIYGFPTNACGWWGYGQIGGATTFAMIKGTIALRVVAHELGHNLGVYHAHALECGSVTLGTDCSSIEYGNPADIMGVPGVAAHFNAFAKERLGWLNYGSSLPIITVTGGGTFGLDPYASSTSAPKALKVLKETDPITGKRTWFYVEYRSGIGFDSNLAGNPNLATGVVVHTGSESTSNSSYVLDMTPETSSWNDPALTTGRAFSDPVSGVSITTTSTGSNGATVSVQRGGMSCVTAQPTVSLSPAATQWAPPGATVSWNVTVKNNDNAACAASSFAVSSAVPAGWSGSLSTPALSLSPGQSGTSTMNVASPASAASGFYDIHVNATATSGTSSAVGTYAVSGPFAIQLATSAASYTRGQVVQISAQLSGGTSGLFGLPVTLVMTPPKGKAQALTISSNSSGLATYQFALRQKDPAGVWTVKATAFSNGLSVSASTTFTVR